MILRHSIYSYLKVGYLLHLMTIGEIMLILLIGYQSHLYQWVTEGDTLFRIIILYPLWTPPIFAQLDARSRYQNYKQIKDQIYTYGFKTVILKPVLKSRCQRDAAVVAAEELGFREECVKYFTSFGYRWYHLLPDFFFKRPSFLFHWRFWQTTFFVARYRQKYDYKSLLKSSAIGDRIISFPYVN